MKTVAIIAGGKSPEHEVSVVSARNIYKALDKSIYNVEIIGISKSGQWYHMPSSSLIDEQTKTVEDNIYQSLCILPFNHKAIRYLNDMDKNLPVDIFFPIAHGVFGEDGVLQGVLENLDKPYVGPGVLGSAIGMDKDVTKSILQHNGIKVTPWYTYFKGDSIDFAKLELMGFPLFVKPANMGSGVGVEKANNIEELKNAINTAFTFDIKILIEKGINGREVETAVLGNLKTEVSGVGEIIVNSGFYTYENKYVNNETKVVIPAENFNQSSAYLLQQTALKAYRCLQLEGLSRVDFFYVNDDEFYLNEVNTLPGFTNISMYPKLWEAEGLEYSKLLTKLCALAEERYALRHELRRNL